MRIYPGTTVDYEFATLGGLGYTGTLNDRQFAALRAEGLTGSLADMFKQFDGTLGGGGPTLSEQVEAILAGTTGFALDPSDVTTMWKESTKVTSVSAASDPVGAFNSKFGTTVYDWQQATAASRPAWDGTGGLTYDGVDDLIDDTSNPVFNAASSMWFACSFKASAVLANRLVGYFSTGLNANVIRLSLEYASNGALVTSVRRDDSIVGATYSTSAGAITAGSQSNVIVQCDLTGANTVTMWRNGTQVLSTALTDSTGPCSATASIRTRWGHASHNDKIGRIAAGTGILSAGQRTSLTGWMGEVAL